MNRRWFLRAPCHVAAICALADKTEKGNLKEVKDDKYTPGQVWSYKTRA